MEPFPSNQLASEESTSNSLERAGDTRPVASYSVPSSYPLESLEVRNAPGVVTPQVPAPLRTSAFSKRKATLVSLAITFIVLVLTAVCIALFVQRDQEQGVRLTVPTQDVPVSDRGLSGGERFLGSDGLLVNGDVTATGVLRVVSGNFVSVLTTERLTANQVITLPNASGELCVGGANNCDFASQTTAAQQAAQLQQQTGQLAQQAAQLAQLQAELGQITIPEIPAFPDSVETLNGQSGAVSIQGSLNRISVNTAGGVVTISAPQDLDANANVQFGNLTIGPGGDIVANTLRQTGAGNDLTLDAGTDAIIFADGGRTFTFPAGGAAGQIICTDSGNCGGAGAAPVLLAPAAAQQDTSADASIFINDVGGGHLVRLQSGGVDRLVVSNSGAVTVYGSLTIDALGSGPVRANGGLLAVGAIDLSSSDITGIAGIGNGGTGAASLTANGILLGNGSSPISSLVAGGVGQCLISTAGAPAFQSCPGSGGVADVNGLVGSVTLQGTANQLSVSTGAGVITFSTSQDINTTSSPTFANVTATTSLTTPSLRLTGLGGTGTVQVANLGQGTTYTLPDPGQSTATICLTTGNCAGVGGGVTSGGGTPGTIAMFTGAQNIEDSIVTQTGSTVTVGGTLALSNALGVAYGGTGLTSAPANGQLLIGNGAGYTQAVLGNSGGLTITNGAGSIGLGVAYGSVANTSVQGNTQLTCPSGTGNLSGGGTVVTLGAGGTCAAVNTINNPTFSTSVTTPIVQGATGISLSGGAGQIALQSNTSISGSVSIAAGQLSIGGPAQAAVISIADGSLHAGTLSVASLAANTSYILPDPGVAIVGICLTTGNCAGSGGGITGSGTTNRVAKFTSTGAIGNSTITDDGTDVSITGDFALQGGDATLGTSSQLGSLILQDGTGQSTTLRAGDSAGNLIFVLPTSAGSASQCLKQSGTGNQLIFDDCDGGSGGSSTTLQQAYANGNTITTSSARDIVFTLANTVTDSDFVITVADDSSSSARIVRVNGTGTNSPGQLLRLDNQDTNLPLTAGLLIQASGGGITDAIDVSDSDLHNALNVGNNNIVGTTAVIDLTNFDVTASGDTTLAGTLSVGGAVTGGTFNGQTISNAASFTGTLNVASATTLGGTLTVSGASALIGTTSLQGSLILNDGSSNTGTIRVNALGQNTVYSLPDPNATSVDICLSSGNCLGGGGGGAPANAEYLTLSNSSSLTNERAIAAGTNVALTDNGANSTLQIGTVANPTFSTSVTTPQLQSSDALSITPGGALTVGATGQTALLQGSAISITSNGATNDITLNSADQIILTSGGNILLQNNTDVTGTLAVTGAVTGGTYNGQTISSAANFTGTLQVGGAVTFVSTLAVQGASTTIGTSSQLGSLILNDGTLHTGTLRTAALAQNTVYTLPDPTDGSDTVCLEELANCGGSGGVSSPGGTANRLAMFTGSQAIGNSWLAQSGSTLSLDSTRNFTLSGGNLTVSGSGTLSGDLAVDTDVLFVNTTTNLVGVGTVIPTAKLTVNYATTSSTAGTERGFSTSVTDAGGVLTGTDTTYGGQISVTRSSGGGTSTINSVGLDISVLSDGGGSVDNVTGLRVGVTQAGGTSNDTAYAATFQGGNVGIGTTAPTQALHVNSGRILNDGGILQLGGVVGSFISDTSNHSFVYSTGSGGAGPFAVAGSLMLQSRAQNNSGIYFATGTTPTVRINVTSAGKVGVGGFGTGTPTSLLQVGDSFSFSGLGLNGVMFRTGGGGTYTDSSGGPTTTTNLNSFGQSTLAASSATATTNASTVYIAGAPIQGTNQTITNRYALWVANDTTRFDGTEVFINTRLTLGVHALSIADNGSGTSPSQTLGPDTPYVEVTCNDPDGCALVMSETGPPADGRLAYIVNVSANTVTVSDTVGVSEIAGTFAMTQYDLIQLIYIGDRWVEASRANNT